MYLVYVDESGDRSYPWTPGTPEHFILSGVAIHEGQWYTLSKAMDDLQEKYLPGSLESVGRIEFHGYDMWHGKKEFRQLCEPERQALLADLWGIPRALGMRDRPARQDLSQEMMFFAIAVDRQQYGPPSGTFRDLYLWAVEELCQRVNVHLSSMHKAGNPQKAIFVFDTRGKGFDATVREAFGTFLWGGTKHMGFLANAVATAFFIHSSDDRVLQLCDVWTYGLRRLLGHGERAAYECMEPYFQRGRDGVMHGVRHFPKLPGFP